MSVVTKLKYGLGNKLFKLVHALIVGEQHNRKVLIYNLLSRHEQNEKYLLFKYFPKLKDLITEIDENQYNKYDNKYDYLLDEEICFAKIESDVILTKGYMMIKYYLLNEEWRKWILNILKPTINITIEKPSLGIHIRAGDYLNFEGKSKYFPVYNADYYLDIIKNYPNHTIYFFTDTGQKFINNHIIPKIKNQYKFIRNSAIEDLIYLSNCDILILSASTFSYWAGYLSSGKIYCPNYFLMIKLQLENWTIIDADRYLLIDYKIYR
jgi:hypothetical protein